MIMPHIIYILSCSNNPHYMDARWNSLRQPVGPVYSERCKFEPEALKRGRKLKGWSRARKDAWIGGNYASDENIECQSRGGVDLVNRSQAS